MRAKALMAVLCSFFSSFYFLSFLFTHNCIFLSYMLCYILCGSFFPVLFSYVLQDLAGAFRWMNRIEKRRNGRRDFRFWRVKKKHNWELRQLFCGDVVGISKLFQGDEFFIPGFLYDKCMLHATVFFLPYSSTRFDGLKGCVVCCDCEIWKTRC